ncbi:MAG: sugar transferase [Actinomycetota bacterium]
MVAEPAPCGEQGDGSGRQPGPVSLSAETAGRPPWRVVFGTLILGVVAGLFGAQGSVLAEMAKEEVWVASGSVQVRNDRIQPESVKVVLESPGLWNPIAAREGISARDFQEDYAVDVSGGTQIVQATFEDTDQDRARRIIGDVLDTYVENASAPPEILQTELLQSHLESLTELESSIVVSLNNSDDLPRLQQIDLQNELVRTRQQITTVIFRLDTRATELAERRRIDPEVVTAPFILEEPVTPDPLKAAVFGFTVGGLVALAAAYLVFHREAQAAGDVSRSPAAGNGSSGFATTGATGADRGRSSSRPHNRGNRLKRTLDVVIAGLVLIVISPLLLVIALLIKLTSRGPVLFKQDRVGLGDRLFTLYKFRTMHVDNDDSEHRAFVEGQLENGDANHTDDGRFKLQDSRVTRVGGPLRRLSLDELPQLLNVLRGDMSLVGPRPALPWEASLFEARYRGRTKAVPGCTGLWQVSGRSQVSVRRMLELDMEYVQTRSTAKDLGILARTPLVVLRGDGAR